MRGGEAVRLWERRGHLSGGHQMRGGGCTWKSTLSMWTVPPVTRRYSAFHERKIKDILPPMNRAYVMFCPGGFRPPDPPN